MSTCIPEGLHTSSANSQLAPSNASSSGTGVDVGWKVKGPTERRKDQAIYIPESTTPAKGDFLKKPFPGKQDLKGNLSDRASYYVASQPPGPGLGRRGSSW